jgi:hypothetical protein
MFAARAASVLACLALAQALAGQQAQAATKKRGSCDCLQWAGVYYDQLGYCGRGKELHFLSKYGFSAAYAATEPISGLPHKVCNDYFKNLKNNSCVNVDLLATSTADDNLYPANSFPADPLATSQWCYVPNDCDTLNGGDYATNTMGFQLGGWNNLVSTSNLSWKICDPVADASVMMKFKTVAELAAIAEESDISISRTMRLAYPVLSITWAEAMYMMEGINAAWDGVATLTDLVDGLTAPPSSPARLMEVHTTLGDAVKAEQGYILDVPGHGDNFHVIRGREVYSVTRIALGDMAYLGGHFYMEFELNCLMGCVTSRVEPPLDLESQ